LASFYFLGTVKTAWKSDLRPT